jgi:DNA-binding winged helix-turn-helix (wHTH) protein
MWPHETVVEFDRGINAAVIKLRIALGDTADKPRYIETLVRRGLWLAATSSRKANRAPRRLGRREWGHADAAGRGQEHSQ